MQCCLQLALNLLFGKLHFVNMRGRRDHHKAGELTVLPCAAASSVSLLHALQDAAAMHLLALSSAVHHPALSADPHILCTVAKVCKDWRGAVQQSGACNTFVDLILSSHKHGIALPKVASFASWLPKHAPLVKSVTITPAATVPSSSSGLTWQEFNEAAMQLLQLAMQLAAAAPATAAPPEVPEQAVPASSTAAAISQPQPQQQPGLRMASFSSSAPGAASMLAVLPPSLTQLDLDLRSSRMLNSGAMAAALARLSSLRELSLVDASTEVFSKAPRSCLAAIAQLSQLTRLKLVGCWLDLDAASAAGEACGHLQQLLLQRLPLQQLELDIPGDPRAVLDMGRLTQLQGLSTVAGFAEGSVLPEQLQSLKLGECKRGLQLATALPLQQLTALSLTVGFRQQEQMLQLAQLTALRQLQLAYTNERAAAATAPTWGQIPQLKSLRITCKPSLQQTAAILAGLGNATSLTEFGCRNRLVAV
jgi:hypothetical protein